MVVVWHMLNTRVRTGAGEGDFAIKALGSDQPAHDSQAEAAHGASDGSSGCALGPHQAVCNGDDSRANDDAHEKIHISAEAEDAHQVLIIAERGTKSLLCMTLSTNTGCTCACRYDYLSWMICREAVRLTRGRY